MRFEAHRGTNISHWLSQSKARGAARRAYFTQADVERIAGWGLDHVRLPIDEEQMWREDGAREPEAFDLLNDALDWCEAAGLKVIVDLHILRSHHFLSKEEPALYHDPEALERFADLWRDLSAALQSRPNDQVAYELLNEAVSRHPDGWNRVSGHVFEVLRALEPERTLVLGSNRFCQVQTFPDLRVPEDDHLMLTFHYYNPMLVTHYTAPWDKVGAYRGPVQYPGRPVPDEALDELDRAMPERGREGNVYFDRSVIDGQIQIAVEAAERTGCFLYCGEFGCYWATPLDVRRRWYKDIVSVFKAYGIGWANWDYKGGFGLITPDGQETGIRDTIFE